MKRDWNKSCDIAIARVAQPAHAADRLWRARSLLFWRHLVSRASAAADAQAVGR